MICVFLNMRVPLRGAPAWLYLSAKLGFTRVLVGFVLESSFLVVQVEARAGPARRVLVLVQLHSLHRVWQCRVPEGLCPRQ